MCSLRAIKKYWKEGILLLAGSLISGALISGLLSWIFGFPYSNLLAGILSILFGAGDIYYWCEYEEELLKAGYKILKETLR